MLEKINLKNLVIECKVNVECNLIAKLMLKQNENNL